MAPTSAALIWDTASLLGTAVSVEPTRRCDLCRLGM